jgi:hypothetical protein
MCAPHIERHRECLPLAAEVFVQLLFDSEQDRMFRILDQVTETDAPGIVVLPQDRREPLVAGDSFNPPIGDGMNLYERFIAALF